MGHMSQNLRAKLDASVKVAFHMNSKTSDIVNGWEKFEVSEHSGYQPPPKLAPEIEEARIQALCALGLDFDTREPTLDFITKLCADLFPGCLAFLTFIDSDWTHMKSSWPPMSERAPIDNRISCEAWMLQSLKPEMLIVEDFAKDGRFQRSPVVVDKPFFRAVAEVPLLSSDGHRIGAFGVLGFTPMNISGEMRQMLVNLSNVAMKEIKVLSEHYSRKRRESFEASREVARSHLQLCSYLHSSQDCITLLDMSQDGWKVLLSNQRWADATGAAVEGKSFTTFWDSFQLAEPQGPRPATQDEDTFAEAKEARRMFKATFVPRHGSSSRKFVIRFKPATSERLDEGLPCVKIPAAGPSEKLHDRPFYFAILTSCARQHLSVLPECRNLEGLEDSLAEAKDPPIIGVTLGALLGRGSSGTVHTGRWQGQDVAVKVMRMELNEEEAKAEGKQMGVIVSQQLSHPNIVKALESGHIRIKNPASQSSQGYSAAGGSSSESSSGYWTDSTWSRESERELTETWIILELCTEGSLQSAIDRADFKTDEAGHWIPDVQKCVHTAIEIASAMAFLHHNNILHSDLTSSNVLLSRDDSREGTPLVAKVSDFGLSRVHAEHRTVATETVGTVTHMPPELLLDNRLSKAADVYAFGVVLWELYTGKRPWAGLSHAQIVASKIKGLPDDQLQWPAGSYKTIKAIAQHCMQYDPHNRPTFDEVIEMLEILQPKEVVHQEQHQPPALLHG